MHNVFFPFRQRVATIRLTITNIEGVVAHVEYIVVHDYLDAKLFGCGDAKQISSVVVDEGDALILFHYDLGA